jgi:SPP1 gp7 family putative phage head morphogenesis protein
MQRERHIAVWLRMLAQKEVSAARNAKKLFKAQGKSIATAYEKSGQSAAEQVITEGMSSWARYLVANYAVTIRDFVNYTNDQLNPSKSAKAQFRDIVQGFIAREAFKKSKLITETTLNKARGIISSGVKEGKGEKEIAGNLEDGIGGAVSDFRAETIARTEVHNAATYGMQAAAEESDRDLTREWVAVEDQRTRPSHADADGQQREMDDPFDVGGEEIDRPGEGSDENSINCRCTVIYIPKEVSIEGGDSGELI